MTEQMAIKEKRPMTDTEIAIDTLKNLAFLSSSRELPRCEKSIYMAIDALEEREKYRAIGTVEELQALKEKSEPREIAEHNFQDEPHHYLCPNCRNIVNYGQKYCEECGQHLNWE